MKKCIKCKVEQSFDKFYKRKDTKDGLQYCCKKCASKYGKQQHEDNKEKIRNYQKQYYQDNKEQILEQHKQWHEDNKEKISVQQKQHRRDNKEAINTRSRQRYQDNKEKINAQERQRYQNNKEKVKIQRRQYRANNKEKINKRNKQWREDNKKEINKQRKNRRQNDIEFKLAGNSRARLRMALKNDQKVGSAIQDLGCSIEYLIQHLEDQFQPGMTWENYGFYGWHVDHARPLSRFDLTDRKQLLEACHYSNLQPMWAEDNLSKGSKVTEDAKR